MEYCKYFNLTLNNVNKFITLAFVFLATLLMANCNSFNYEAKSKLYSVSYEESIISSNSSYAVDFSDNSSANYIAFSPSDDYQLIPTQDIVVPTFHKISLYSHNKVYGRVILDNNMMGINNFYLDITKSKSDYVASTNLVKNYSYIDEVNFLVGVNKDRDFMTGITVNIDVDFTL